MAAEKGSALLLKKGVLPGTTIAGLRTTALSINGEMVDITNKDSAGVRELLAGAGITTFSLTADGVFENQTEFLAIETASINKTLDNYVLLFENGRTFDGLFQAANVEEAGDFNGEVTYSITLESSGVITITP